ncbi:ANTAR domain-containing protein [Streptomyces sp. NPDC017936]|uniref:ANTAR domain-containing protein n=1 Tax=Streptomyces sp. NPDC017936 TaxID=3365016 RepID=UPI0037A239DE
MTEPAFDANTGNGGDRVRAATSEAVPARTVSVPEVDLRPDAGRVVVAVRGELDLDSAEQLGHTLRGALAAAVDGVDLELGEVAFCDCAALNVLLTLREQGLKQGKTLVVRSAGPVVERLLTLTGTASLFAGADPREARRERGAAPPPAARDDGTGDGGQDPRVEVVQLRRAMQTRPVIDLARGILMASFALSAEEAWRVLVEASQRTNTKLHHLARDLVSAVQGEPPAEAVREQVAAAVAKIRSGSPASGGGERYDA